MVVMREANKLTELIKFASIVVGSVPMLIAYPFVQKYFEKGFMAGAVKGADLSKCQYNKKVIIKRLQ